MLGPKVLVQHKFAKRSRTHFAVLLADNVSKHTPRRALLPIRPAGIADAAGSFELR